MDGLHLETCTSNLKYVALTVLELLASYTPKFRGSRDTSHALFRTKRSCTVAVNMRVKFEVRTLTVLELLAFNAHFKTGLIDRFSAHTHTYTQNHIERTKNYLRHSLRSLGGDNNWHNRSLFTVGVINPLVHWT